MSREVSPIPEQLRKLMRRADATATKADAVVRDAIRGVRGALAVIATDEPVATSAKAREKAFAEIRRRMERLKARLDELTRAALDYAGEMAADAAEDETGLKVEYSKRRADEMVALVSPNQGENIAAVFTDKMGEHVIDALRNAVVASFRENAVAGGSMKSLAREIGRKWQSAAKRHETFVFVDSSGRTWDTKTYLAMNVRTNAMRVYNDLLIDDMARATGSDLVRVSRGGDPSCDGCGPWEGVILSVSGKTKGFPTYDQAKAAGCFHPNCTHTLEYVDEVADADEIARQRKHPFDAKDGMDEDVARKRQHEIEEEAYRDEGMDAAAAKVAVDRDRLADAVRNGLLAEDADEIVKELTDAQVKALCKAGMPPEFVPTKGTKKKPEAEKWRRGSRGGVVHVRRGATAKDIVRVCGLDEDEEADGWKPQTDLEKATDALMQSIGVKHTDARLEIEGVNPRYGEGKKWRNNCQRCVPTYEARCRGYDVTAMSSEGDKTGLNLADHSVAMWKNQEKTFFKARNFKAEVERTMRGFGDGARAEIRIGWKGCTYGHVFVAVQENGATMFLDPQNPTSNASEYFTEAAPRGRNSKHWLLRIDDNEFTEEAKRCFSSRV